MKHHFVYFIPALVSALKIATPELFKEIGLEHALGDRGLTSRGTDKGPGDGGGLLVVVNDLDGNAPMVEYDAAVQTWRKGPDGKFWVGMFNDERPGPEDLARRRQISGEAVELLDKQMWTIPIARSVTRASTLPKALILSDDGKTWLLEDLPEFLGLCADADQIFKWFFEGTTDAAGKVSFGVPYADAMPMCIRALGVNYRIALMEVALLKNFGDDSMMEVLGAILDLPETTRVAESRQKKRPGCGPSSSIAGSEASSPITSPPSVT